MQLRDLTTIEEYEQVVGLERLIWGSTYDDVVPVPVFIITVRRGAVLIGAFAEGEMVGFVYSLAGLKHGRPMQWSHMLGVVDSHRNSGLGRLLKLEQRQRTMAMGLDLVEWTFDPLQALNAHLNFSRLGVIVREDEENIYGESSSPLHRGSPTDRFVAEWWLSAPRVLARLGETSAGTHVTSGGAAALNITRSKGDWKWCASVRSRQAGTSDCRRHSNRLHRHAGPRARPSGGLEVRYARDFQPLLRNRIHGGRLRARPSGRFRPLLSCESRCGGRNHKGDGGIKVLRSQGPKVAKVF